MNGEPLPILNGFPGATGRARILCDLLDEMPVVDSRAGRARRKLLDEDGVSRAGHSRGGNTNAEDGKAAK